MARRKNTQAEAAAEVENTTTEAPEEAAVTTTEEVAPEVTENESTESTEETVFDLTEFEAAVSAAVAEKDESTGDVPLALVENVTTAYRALDGLKAKNAAKKHVNETMTEAMNDLDIVTARAYLQISEHLTAGHKGGGGGEKAPADPTEAAVQRIATLQLARDFVVVPEGVADDLDERVERFLSENADAVKGYIEYLQSNDEDATEPEVSSVVKNAAKLALGKQAKAGGRSGGGSTFTGERRDIGKHITEAFADQPVGTFLTVAEIRKFKSEEYGDNPPSAGAISARLFPGGDGTKSTMRKVGLESGTNEKGNKGALKQTEGESLDD